MEDWTIQTLKLHYDALLKERDERYMQLFSSAQQAVEVAKTAVASSRSQTMAIIALAVTILLAGLSGVGGLIFYLTTNSR